MRRSRVARTARAVDLAQHVGSSDRDADDARSRDLAIEIARDRLGLR